MFLSFPISNLGPYCFTPDQAKATKMAFLAFPSPETLLNTTTYSKPPETLLNLTYKVKFFSSPPQTSSGSSQPIGKVVTFIFWASKSSCSGTHPLTPLCQYTTTHSSSLNAHPLNTQALAQSHSVPWPRCFVHCGRLPALVAHAHCTLQAPLSSLKSP